MSLPKKTPELKRTSQKIKIKKLKKKIRKSKRTESGLEHSAPVAVVVLRFLQV
jgi:hypothetical protein